MTESTVNLEATVFTWMDVEAGAIETGILDRSDGQAMFVFCSGDEAERFRTETGVYPAAEGWGVVSLVPEDMRGLLEIHEVSHVAFPQELKDGGCHIHFYEAPFFLTLLEAAPMFQDALEN